LYNKVSRAYVYRSGVTKSSVTGGGGGGGKELIYMVNRAEENGRKEGVGA